MQGHAHAHGGAPARAEDGYVRPRDALELQLAGIWEEVLGAGPIGARDDFFARGGDSLRALDLLDAVRRRTGRMLSLERLFDDATVEGAAAALRDQRASGRAQSLVPLAPPSAGPPLFCVHSIVGTAMRYLALARLLAGSYRVCAFQARGIVDGRDAHESIEDMARDYVAELRALQPEGPYRVCGYSMGGIVAHEMARALAAGGERVELLAVFDTGADACGFDLAHPPLPPVHTIALSLCDDAALARIDAQPGERAQLDVLLEEARARGTVPPDYDGDRLAHLLAVVKVNMRSLAAFELRPYPGRLTLLRTADAERARDLGWAPYAREVDVVDVPGAHSTMLDAPNVTAVARALEERAGAPVGGDRG